MAEKFTKKHPKVILLKNKIDLMQGFLFSDPSPWHLTLRANQNYHPLDRDTFKMIEKMMQEFFPDFRF